MKIATAPRMSATMRERVNAILAGDCDGQGCADAEVAFTRRVIAGNVTIHMQCQGCARSVSGALKRSEFPYWQDFPEWNAELVKAREAEWDAAYKARQETLLAEVARQDASFQEAQERRSAEIAERRADYRRWLQTSPDWATLRDRVMRRAMHTCEACLGNQAKDVHHVTYELGRLPPAWELRAVCRACHDRLHDWTGGE
jgi:hypothetical protein